MNNYGKVGTGGLALTGAVKVMGMNSIWALATAAGLMVVGAVLMRVTFRRGRPSGQR